MRFHVITIFPEMIKDYSKVSIIARAIKKKFISLKAINLRDFTNDNHQTVDGRPYGGGFGMVMRADVWQKAINRVAGLKGKTRKSRVILLSPQGKKFSQKDAQRLAKQKSLTFVCGRYEGFDERVLSVVDEEFSIGDYVLMGGELPALVMVETISRFIPGVVGKAESVAGDTFSENNLEYPQYTRPEVLKVGKKTMRVPKVLLSGNHSEVEKWRTEQSLKKTQKRRPDLLENNA
jgi:tRNA (guanine37-N1)-methyltransferase